MHLPHVSSELAHVRMVLVHAAGPDKFGSRMNEVKCSLFSVSSCDLEIWMSSAYDHLLR